MPAAVVINSYVDDADIPRDISIDKPRVLKTPWLWLLWMENWTREKVRDEFRLPGKGVLASQQSASAIFPGQDVKPLVAVFVEIATCFLDFKEIDRGWDELGERFEVRMRAATMTLRAMTAVSLSNVSPSSGRLFLLSATHFDPLNFGAGEDAFIKKSLYGLRDERIGQQRETKNGEKRQSKVCHFCHEDIESSFFDHNKVCKKPRDQRKSKNDTKKKI